MTSVDIEAALARARGFLTMQTHYEGCEDAHPWCMAIRLAAELKDTLTAASVHAAEHRKLRARVEELEGEVSDYADFCNTRLKRATEPLRAQLAEAKAALERISKMPGGSVNMARAATAALAKLSNGGV